MPAIDGLHRSGRRATPRPRVASEPPTTRPSGHGRGRGVSALLAVLGIVALGLLSLRPTPGPKAAPSIDNEPQDLVSDEPNQSLALPRAANDTLVDDLLILDQPTDRSSPQPDAVPDSTVIGGSEVKSFTVRILNGGGRVGAASALKTDLETSGYTVTSLGNARTTYAQTTIYHKHGLQEQATALGEALGEPAPGVLENVIAAPADILVVIGTDRP